MVVQDHKVVHFGTNREQVCNFLLTLDLPCPASEIGSIAGFLLKTTTNPYFRRNLEIFLLDYIAEERDSMHIG